MKKCLKFLITLACATLILYPAQSNAAGQLAEKNDVETLNNQKIMSAVWMYCSGEYKALCYQAYNAAIMYVEDAVEKISIDDKPLAVVVDCDEAILDNGEYEAGTLLTKENSSLDKLFSWFRKEKSKLIPGALEMLQKIDAMDVEIFFVTNRKEAIKDATLKRMNELGIPNADEEHVLFSSKSSSKQERFNKISEDYQIVTYIGDSLADFPIDFSEDDWRKACSDVEEISEKFGTEFIIIPNPLYGAWEKKLMEGYYSKSAEERARINRKILEECLREKYSAQN